MGRINLADDGGLDTMMAVSAFEVDNLEGNDGVDDDFTAEVSKIYSLLCHAALLILINLLIEANL
jgi:hypothetical protein